MMGGELIYIRDAESVLGLLSQVEKGEGEPSGMVPLRPLCEELGIDFSIQRKTIADNYLYAPFVGLKPTLCDDDKRRRMICLPLVLVPLWVMAIHPRNVKKERQGALLDFQRACFDILYGKQLAGMGKTIYTGDRKPTV